MLLQAFSMFEDNVFSACPIPNGQQEFENCLWGLMTSWEELMAQTQLRAINRGQSLILRQHPVSELLLL